MDSSNLSESLSIYAIRDALSRNGHIITRTANVDKEVEGQWGSGCMRTMKGRNQEKYTFEDATRDFSMASIGAGFLLTTIFLLLNFVI